MAADCQEAKRVRGRVFQVWLQLSKREQTKTGPSSGRGMNPAVGSAEIRELPGRAGPINANFFWFTAILSLV